MERTQLLCSAVKKPGAPSTSDLVLTWTVGAGVGVLLCNPKCCPRSYIAVINPKAANGHSAIGNGSSRVGNTAPASSREAKSI